MARRRRFWLPDLAQHVVQRGNNRVACFFGKDDYRIYLRWLGALAQREDCAVHAWVLMTNHVHLLITPGAPDSLARLMQSLGRRYVGYVNRRYGRTGTLWEGRYKASLVQTEEYLLNCLRYIELNPVRAGLSADPGAYRWSSYRHHAFGAPDPLESRHPVYVSLGDDDFARQEAYRALLLGKSEASSEGIIREATFQCRPIGDEQFRKSVSARLGVGTEPVPRGRPRKGVGGSPGDQPVLELA